MYVIKHSIIQINSEQINSLKAAFKEKRKQLYCVSTEERKKKYINKNSPIEFDLIKISKTLLITRMEIIMNQRKKNEYHSMCIFIIS